tara:strand:- start:6355 stop:6573 length:219 start_codon:yes stop_codon:yes gene_type:complete
MAFSTTYRYEDRNIIDIRTLILSVRFLIANCILAVIFLFLAIEEIDWSIFSSKENLEDHVIDNTSWNLSDLF